MKKHQLQKQILQTKLQLKKMDIQPSSSDICNQLYNTLILRKAVLSKELENLERIPFIEKLKKTFSKREKLICDYFKS